MAALVVDAPGTSEHGLFARDKEGRPLVFETVTERSVPFGSRGARPALSGRFELKDGRAVVPAFQLLAEAYLDPKYAPEAVAAETGVPAGTKIVLYHGGLSRDRGRITIDRAGRRILRAPRQCPWARRDPDPDRLRDLSIPQPFRSEIETAPLLRRKLGESLADPRSALSLDDARLGPRAAVGQRSLQAGVERHPAVARCMFRDGQVVRHAEHPSSRIVD